MYGDEHTVGLEEIIRTDYMSSEHSDEGVIGKAEFTQHRDLHGGESAFEVRREMWRSAQVCCYRVFPVILVHDLLLDNSSTACTLVYRHLLTELGSQPRRVALRLGDAGMLASPVAPDIEAWTEMQIIDAHLEEAKRHLKLL